MELRQSKHEKVWIIITIGDGMVGKTCLLHRFVDENFDVSYEPTIFDMQEFEITVNGASHLVKLYDTAGQETYDQLRQTFYKDADCFLICFSVDNRTSFNNVMPFWMKDISSVNHVPVVLCATKIDKRRTEPDCVTEQEGRDLARKIGAAHYVECSAKTNAGVVNTIQTAVSTAIYAKQDTEQQNKRFTGQNMASQNQNDNSQNSSCCCFL